MANHFDRSIVLAVTRPHVALPDLEHVTREDGADAGLGDEMPLYTVCLGCWATLRAAEPGAWVHV